MHPNSDKFNSQIADTAIVLIGKYCADRRKELGYTQKTLADKVGCDRSHLVNFENGKQNISIRVLVAIFGCLDMHLELRPKDGDRPAGFPVVSKN